MADYNKGLFRQLEEQTIRAESLEKENRHLKEEVRALSKKVETLLATIDERVEKAVQSALDKELPPLQEEIACKDAALVKANLEISRLKAIVNKDSGNSSKPPSTDGFKRVPNSREKTGNPPGGRKGHPGHRLSLPDNIDELVALELAEVKVIDYTNGSSVFVSKWEMDIQVKTVFTEYRFLPGAPMPNDLYNEVSYGKNIKTMAVLLSTEGLVARERLALFFKQITRDVLNPSEAALGGFFRQMSKGLAPELEAIKTSLQNGKVINTDDTPMRCSETLDYGVDKKSIPVLKTAEKGTFTVTVRTHSNDNSTLLTLNPQKDKEGIERDGILPKFHGTLSHDHESKFYNYGTDHGTCGEHLVRDLRGLSDLYNSVWANDMRDFVLSMNDHKNYDLNMGRQSCEPQMLELYSHIYDAMLEAGEQEVESLGENGFGRKEIRTMLTRLKEYKHNYLLFMIDYEVPFTNNLSERDLRPCKTKQKVSGSFRSWSGLTDYLNIRSFLSTLRKRGLDTMNGIKSVFNGTPVLT